MSKQNYARVINQWVNSETNLPPAGFYSKIGKEM
jgi:hypothetical protein